jgi:hypothetical protein
VHAINLSGFFLDGVCGAQINIGEGEGLDCIFSSYSMVMLVESGFGTHLGTYTPMHHRWMLPSTIEFFV